MALERMDADEVLKKGREEEKNATQQYRQAHCYLLYMLYVDLTAVIYLV